jgi:hypothetical protein
MSNANKLVSVDYKYYVKDSIVKAYYEETNSPSFPYMVFISFKKEWWWPFERNVHVATRYTEEDAMALVETINLESQPAYSEFY